LVVHADRISKRYGSTCVVDGVSFAVPPGECCGILGPNGAGKTTTLRMLTGLTPPSGGRLEVLGHPIPEEARLARRRVGIVPQQDNLDLDFTVAENLTVYGRYFGLSGREIRRRIPELLELATLSDRAHSRVNQLSGGMKRRLSIARALIARPELLILDEPTTGLDPQVRQNLWHMLRQLRKDGVTVILTTHYMDEAERLCNRIVLMDRGRILADQSPKSLIRDRIEPLVLEVHGRETGNWHDSAPLPDDIRCERVGESFFYYGENLECLVQSLNEWADLHYALRPANLEDVFLKLTGRELRDG
jgi:lipooligosaccharide transport system ATP-binding protein